MCLPHLLQQEHVHCGTCVHVLLFACHQGSNVAAQLYHACTCVDCLAVRQATLAPCIPALPSHSVVSCVDKVRKCCFQLSGCMCTATWKLELHWWEASWL
jgi:hypothetical protein